MKKVCVLTVLALVVVLTNSAFAQDDDPVRLPSTGHYYQAVYWYSLYQPDARVQALQMSFHGVQGYLVVITSWEEQVLCNYLRFSKLNGGTCWIGLSRENGYAPWVWEVTGEPYEWSFWWDNEGIETTPEHFVWMRTWVDNTYGYWESTGNGVARYSNYIVEFPDPPPTADAGQDQSVTAGTLVTLDGGDSTDPDEDPLTFSWEMSSIPNESLAALNDPSSMTPCFTADVPGDYVITLVVTDSFGASSEADNVTVNAFSWQQEVVDTLNETITTIDGFPPDVFKNANMKKALFNKINAVLQLIDLGSYGDAYNKLKNDLLKKTDGCANSGAPDKNDWIKNCEAQNQLYPLITYAIDLLELVR